MKLFLVLTLFIATNVFAVDICSFEETWQVEEAFKAEGIKAHKKSKNFKRFTFAEKEMIHLTVTLQEWQRGLSRQEAINTFVDLREDGKPGDLAGEIKYFNVKDKVIVLVHYWPGENEYGAYYELNNGAHKLIAEIDDSFISCTDK